MIPDSRDPTAVVMLNGSGSGGWETDSYSDDEEVWLPQQEEALPQLPTIQVTWTGEPRDRRYGDMVKDGPDNVVLPRRYLELCTQAAKRRSRAASEDQGSGRPSQSRQPPPTDPRRTRTSRSARDEEADRRKDLDTAISWLRQEIVKLKQQDKILLRQFLELRALMHKLRAHPRTSSCSASNEVSVHESTVHLNMLPVDERAETPPGGRSGSQLRGEECAVEFRDRTRSMLTTRDARYLHINRRKTKECM